MNHQKIDRVRKTNSALKDSLKSCSICPRKCHVNRTIGKTGYCRASYNPIIYSYAPHHGEEPPLSGRRGSGTIFFSHCNMKCVYCQNYRFSQLDEGEEVSVKELAGVMLRLQESKCHNINLVTPTHYVPQILTSLEIALESGLNIPIVYNTSGYELVDTIKLLDGIVDIYLPDMRYSDNFMAKKYSDAAGYVEHNRSAVREMYSQVGNLVFDASGIAVNGLIIRLLVLPNNASGTTETLKYIRYNISENTYLSIMSQYYPAFKARNYKEISRSVSVEEYKNVVDCAHLLGLNNGWIQDSPEKLDPRFRGTNIKPKAMDDGKEIG
ncbi:MAG: radical SAM protein [Candidatus Omnitrophica bacterium]|nr:radical SAM protein [Candidatus Omnitrophota bacterium]